jgi:hypothetical protein
MATRIWEWLSNLGVGTRSIEGGGPWEDGFLESLNGRMRDELLDRESFYTVKEAEHLIEMWRWEYDHVRPHSSFGYKPPAPQAWIAVGEPFRLVSPTPKVDQRVGGRSPHDAR